jgi:hypothetical protein
MKYLSKSTKYVFGENNIFSIPVLILLYLAGDLERVYVGWKPEDVLSLLSL